MMRKALLDALMPDEELRHLWLRDAGFYHAVNQLVRALPAWVNTMADWAKAGQPDRIRDMMVALGGTLQDQLEPPQEAVDAERLAEWWAQQ